ncbi:hypothetical protein ACH5RR_031358 [Cinchona calisaya]|uniref:Uncharacterized protein n=1 Tax=Cinchona calisaya TaxID=153742 RepID=A0ABD2YGY4_9GENT
MGYNTNTTADSPCSDLSNSSNPFGPSQSSSKVDKGKAAISSLPPKDSKGSRKGDAEGNRHSDGDGGSGNGERENSEKGMVIDGEEEEKNEREIVVVEEDGKGRDKIRRGSVSRW